MIKSAHGHTGGAATSTPRKPATIDDDNQRSQTDAGVLARSALGLGEKSGHAAHQSDLAAAAPWPCLAGAAYAVRFHHGGGWRSARVEPGQGQPRRDGADPPVDR